MAFLAASTARALEEADIPADAPDDALMASPAEIQQMQDWASTVFTGRRTPGHEPAVGVELRRQDYSVLRFGQSCIDTPIKLGTREFKHGLGTHANSEIILHLPPDATEFKAVVGIDNNFDSGGVRGSVQFSVELAGREVFRTPTLCGSNEPVDVRVPLPPNTRELTLKVDTTPDGPAYDQADWADACIVSSTGQVHWADEDAQPFLAAATPFSFRCEGAASSNFLPGWQRTVEAGETPSRHLWQAHWQDPKTALRLTATVTAFKRYPAVEWVLELENRGDAGHTAAGAY